MTLGPGPDIRGRRVLVIEDGPTITHGGMPFGAGTVAARQHGAATIVDPRPWAVGSIADTFARYPAIGPVLPAMGYSPEQLDELAATIRAVECDVVVTGTPIDLGRLLDVGHPLRHATYDLRELGHPDLADTLAPLIERALATSTREERAPTPGPRALIVVPASPRSTATASSIAPIAAHPSPDAAKSVAASTLGPIDPGSNASSDNASG